MLHLTVTKRPLDKITVDATYTDVASPDPSAALFTAFAPAAKLILYSTSLSGGAGDKFLALTTNSEDFREAKPAARPLLAQLQWIYGQQDLLIASLRASKVTIDQASDSLSDFTATSADEWDETTLSTKSDLVADALEGAATIDTGSGVTKGLHDAMDSATKLYAGLAGAVPQLSAADLKEIGKLLNSTAALQSEIDSSSTSLVAAATAARDAAKVLRKLDVKKALAKSQDFSIPDKGPRSATLKVKAEDALTKKVTDLATVTVAWAETRWEVSVGPLFSKLPNRTFQNTAAIVEGKIEAAADGKTNTTVTESVTRPSIVPFALAHFRVGETAKYDRRWAFLVSGGMGISPYSGTTDFAAGFTVAYRSIFMSPLVHFGRDIRLTSGLTRGTSLGSSPPAVPTERFWSPQFGVAVSARIF